MRWFCIRSGLCLFMCVSLSSGCADAGNDGDTSRPGMVTGTPSWWGEVRPLVTEHCTPCHQPGAAGPFPLTTYDEVRGTAAASLNAMDAGRMPPWPADDACRSYRGERLLPAEDLETFRAWVHAQTPEGDPNLAAPLRIPTEEVADFEATHVTQPLGPYVPSDVLSDDYRCFPLDLELATDTYLTASKVIPGAGDLVHHVLVYAVPEDRSDELDALDDADPGAGFTCFGGTDVGVPNPIGAWVPGMPPIVLDNGTAMMLRAGSRFIMQVHYNFLAADPTEDLTQWHVRMSEEEPTELIESRPFAHRMLHVPAGEADSVQQLTWTNKTGETWKVAAVAPHMHLFGTRVRVEHIAADGAEACLVDIPRWDFNWQMPYRLHEEDYVEIPPGESVRLTCHYDNSQANQPIVDGEPMMPADIFWGDGTLDEMCLTYLTVIRPFEAPTPQCSAFADCWHPCELEGRTSYECMTSCMGADVECALCMIPDVFTDGGCVDQQCVAEMEEADKCLLECAAGLLGSGEDVDTCMENLCPAARANLDGCATPALKAGHCDAAMTACNAIL